MILRNVLFPLVLFLGAAFNGYVMPRRIQGQVDAGALSPKTGRRFCILWRCWGVVFLGLGILTIVLTFLRK
jgi:hypothetical protein